MLLSLILAPAAFAEPVRLRTHRQNIDPAVTSSLAFCLDQTVHDWRLQDVKAGGLRRLEFEYTPTDVAAMFQAAVAGRNALFPDRTPLRAIPLGGRNWSVTNLPAGPEGRPRLPVACEATLTTGQPFSLTAFAGCDALDLVGDLVNQPLVWTGPTGPVRLEAALWRFVESAGYWTAVRCRGSGESLGCRVEVREPDVQQDMGWTYLRSGHLPYTGAPRNLCAATAPW